MRYHRFGNTSLQCSVLGLGTWPLGGLNTVDGVPIGWRPVSTRQAEATIKSAIDAGINFFDTSDFYGQGESELKLGKALAGVRQDVIIATKGGITPRIVKEPVSQLIKDFDPDRIARTIDASLSRLNTDWIDLYQLHGPGREVLHSDRIWETLERAREAGKIRYVGVSMDSDESTIADLIANSSVDSIQVRYNLANINYADSLRKVNLDGRAVITRSPFEHGLFLNKYVSVDDFHEEDHRRSRIRPDKVRQSEEFYQESRRLLPDKTASPASLPLLWLMSDPIVSVSLFGATSPDQVKDNCNAAELALLSEDEKQRVRELADRIFGKVVSA